MDQIVYFIKAWLPRINSDSNWPATVHASNFAFDGKPIVDIGKPRIRNRYKLSIVTHARLYGFKVPV